MTADGTAGAARARRSVLPARPPEQENTADELVELARVGDPAGMHALYQTLAPRVRAYLSLRGVEDPEGLTNEVFLKLLPRLGTVIGGFAGVRALGFAIAHGLVVDEARRRDRRPLTAPYESEHDPRTTDSAEDQALDRDGAAEVLAVLHLLPDDQREVVVLRVLGELSVDETASATGRSKATVKRLQSKALATLRRLLEQSADLADARGRGKS